MEATTAAATAATESTGFLDAMVVFATQGLIPLMVVMFVGGVILRSLIYYTVRRQKWFALEFEKRVDRFLEERSMDTDVSFYMACKKLFEKTYYELFRVRYAMKRRRPDVLLTVTDRVFLIKQGTAFLIKDILKPLKHLRYNNSNHPKLLSTTKKAFSRNPSFSKVFGIFPNATLNDIINILPGIFIILGVFGTFLGIMKALPDLGAMDMADMDASKQVMDAFLVKISFSMSTSLYGIVLSVCTSMLNAALAPEKIFVSAVDRLEASLDCIWHLSANNDLPASIENFDENKDPEEALAIDALKSDIKTGNKKLGPREAA